MNDEQPTQPLTDAELSAIRELWGDICNSNTEETPFGASMVPADIHLFDLKFAKVIAEVDRLRAALTALGRNERAAANRSLELQEENEQLAAKLEQRTTQWGVLCNLREQDAQEYLELKARMDQLRSEATGTALGNLAKIERLQSQRDALVRKLGLDWGPDEFGDLSAVHVQSIEITNCPDEYCPGWKDSGICPNDYRHRY